ncbi:MAG: glycosyltransferase family 39 protein, partial [Chloroflexi bacterium]|nr:glycosyltransferase family 39 protein [Chloroflexota bacterium]
AIVGQMALYAAPEGLGCGLALSALAALVFVWISARRKPPAWIVALVARLSLSFSTLWIASAAGLSVMAAALSVVFEQTDRVNYLPVLVLWAASGGAYLAAFAGGWGGAAGWREWLKAHRRELVGIGLVALAAGFVRFYRLGAIPRVINGDEGLLGRAALLTGENPLANPFASFENFGGLYMQAIGLALQAFGRTPFGLRLLPAIGGTLAVLTLYLLGRRLFGMRVAFFAAILLALAHTHIHFSRTVAVGYIQGTFSIPLELYFFISGLENRSRLRLAVGGLLLGLHFGVYLSAQLVAAFLIVYCVVAAVLDRPLIQSAARPLAAFWGGSVLMAFPLIVTAWLKPQDVFARLNADGTFQSGWLARTMAETGQSAARILAGRVAHAFLSLNYYPAQDFYGARIPMLDVLTGVLFVLGLGYALWRTRDYRHLLLNGYFWSATVAIGVFSVPPSADSYRMLIALPAAILLAALGWEQVLGVLSLAGPDRAAARVAFSAFVISAVLLINVRAYFVDFAAKCRYGGDLQTRFASYLGNYLRTLDSETKVFLLSDDALRYGTHSSVDFLSGGLPVTNVPDPATSLQPGANSAVIAVPSRADELKAWAGERRDGYLHREYDCDSLMLSAYRIPPYGATSSSGP